MTPEQKMQKVVEAADECWQEGNPTRFISTNPSPTDLNELFRLAEKLYFNSILLDSGIIAGKILCQLIRFGECGINLQIEIYADSQSEALLNALYESINGD